MAKLNINIGSSANDKTGDPLRTAFSKVNANFTELYTLTGGTSTALIELAQDYAAPLFNHASHTNITVTYDDANNKILLTGVAAQVQTDWNASSGLGVILNKPTIPAAQVSADWNSSSGVTQILNKPTIPTSFSSLVNGSHTLSLGSTGNTTFPTNISINYSGGNVLFPRIIADTGKAFSVQGQGNSGSAALSWTVDPDAAGQYAAVAVTRAGGDNLAKVVLQAQSNSGDAATVKLWKFDETGKLTLPAAGLVEAKTTATLTVGAALYATYLEIEQLWVDVRNADAAIIAPATRPWAGMPSHTAYPIIAAYTPPGGVSLPSGDVIVKANNAKNAYTDLAVANVKTSVAGKEWTFSAYGALTLPQSGTITSDNVTVRGQTSAAIKVTNAINPLATRDWVFDGSGKLTIPGGLYIAGSSINNKFDDGNGNIQEGKITTSTTFVELLSSNNVTGADNTQLSTIVTSPTAVIITNTQEGALSTGVAGQVNISASGITISQSQGNGATQSDWTFGTTGNLTLPKGSVIGNTTEIVTVTLDQFTAGGYSGTRVFTKVSATQYELSPTGPYMTLISNVWRLKVGPATYYDSTDLITWNPIAGSSPAPVGTLGTVASINLGVGSNTWGLSENGTLTLPAGGVISEGGGLTGAIKLTPAGGANAYQALLIYPTAGGDGDHVHLTAGGGTTELYLGNDNHYVKLVNGGNVEVRAFQPTSPYATAVWGFGTDGAVSTTKPLIINVPNGVPSSVGAIGATTGSWELNPRSNLATTGGSGSGLTVNVTETGGYASAIAIATAGTGYLDGELITVTSGSSSASFIIAVTGNRSWTFGTDGKLTTPGNLQVNGGKIILNTGGSAYVESVDYGVNSANSAVNIFGGPYQKIKLRAGFGTEAAWTFDPSGSLTFPDGTTTTGKSITVPVDQSLTVNTSYSMLPGGATTFKINPESIKLPTGNGTIFSGTETAANSWGLDSANKTLYFPDAGDGVFPQIRYNTAGNDGMQLFTGAKPIKITTASNTHWTFGTTGNLTLPASGDVVDSTSVSQLARRVEGSWTVTNGTSTYSFTVPMDGTYTMWVKGNIPNGIITWNATLSISNTNVPAIGTQYAWNYTGGGSPILLTAIPDQIRGSAGTISTDNTYAGTTSNRFDFGISNTSGSSQTIYYGYIRI